jgi:hypothetical protein
MKLGTASVASPPPAIPIAKSGSAFLDPKKNLVSLLSVVLVLGGSGWVIYRFVLNREGKKIVDVIATQSGVGRTVIPWADRAESVLKITMDKNRDTIATSVQGICHPTGSHPSFDSYDIRRVGDMFSVDIRVKWKGGLLGQEYTTVVIWEFKQSGQVRAAVTSESAVVGVAPANAKKLDEWFRTQMYAVFRTNMGD